MSVIQNARMALKTALETVEVRPGVHLNVAAYGLPNMQAPFASISTTVDPFIERGQVQGSLDANWRVVIAVSNGGAKGGMEAMDELLGNVIEAMRKTRYNLRTVSDYQIAANMTSPTLFCDITVRKPL
jgi:hypothetical protein